VEDRGALLDVGGAPLGIGALCGGEGFVEVGFGRQRELGDRLSVDRVDDGEAVAVLARFPRAVDEELEVGFVSHTRADRLRLMRSQRPATATDKGESSQ